MTSINKTIPQADVERQDSLKDQFLSLSPSEAEQWIQDNVNDLATAKVVLGRMAKILNAIAHKVGGI